jgi:hypothetical protein
MSEKENEVEMISQQTNETNEIKAETIPTPNTNDTTVSVEKKEAAPEESNPEASCLFIGNLTR